MRPQGLGQLVPPTEEVVGQVLVADQQVQHVVVDPHRVDGDEEEVRVDLELHPEVTLVVEDLGRHLE